MDSLLLFLDSSILVLLIVLFTTYLKKETSNIADRESDRNYIEHLLNTIQNKQEALTTCQQEIDIKNQELQNKILEFIIEQKEQFNRLSNHVKITQDQVNHKINSSFDLLQNETIDLRKITRDNVVEYKKDIKEYNENNKAAFDNYKIENENLRISNNKIKEEIILRLEGILNEIKAPLDLD